MNVNTPPALLVLCSAQGIRKESALNKVTWTLPNTLAPQDNQNYAAFVSLQSFHFVNMNENIVTTHGRKTNTLKFLTTYKINGVAQEHIITINLIPGYYTITELLAEINTKFVAAHPTDGKYYGWGKYDDIGTYPVFKTAAHNKAKVTYNPPPLAALGAVDPTHLYTGFYMILDDDTQGLMKMLGLLRSDREDGSILNLKTIGSYSGLGFNVLVNSGVYSYQSYTIDTEHSLDAINLGNQSMVILWEGQAMESRSSLDGMNLGQTIAVVPSLGWYGSAQVYEPVHPFQAVITNFNPYIFTLSIIGAHDGAPWDFHGIDWTITLKIEYREIDTELHNAAAASGDYITRHPYFHDTLVDYNLPFSGKRSRS